MYVFVTGAVMCGLMCNTIIRHSRHAVMITVLCCSKFVKITRTTWTYGCRGRANEGHRSRRILPCTTVCVYTYRFVVSSAGLVSEFSTPGQLWNWAPPVGDVPGQICKHVCQAFGRKYPAHLLPLMQCGCTQHSAAGVTCHFFNYGWLGHRCCNGGPERRWHTALDTWEQWNVCETTVLIIQGCPTFLTLRAKCTSFKLVVGRIHRCSHKFVLGAEPADN